MDTPTAVILLPAGRAEEELPSAGSSGRVAPRLQKTKCICAIFLMCVCVCLLQCILYVCESSVVCVHLVGADLEVGLGW